MYKVLINCRNRLAITTKALTSLIKHSSLPHQIFIYDNLTNFLIKEHFLYFSLLYEKGLISQATFNTKESTFGAFSKAVASNQFGLNHEQDPEKDKYSFLLFLDNDMIVTPGFDKILLNAWNDVKNFKMNHIKIISQLPGGIKSKQVLNKKIAGFHAKTGNAGGSGFWSVRSDFFRDVGYLPVEKFIGINKKHDQIYWNILEKTSKGQDYILGLDKKLCIHCGKISGSTCNVLTKNKNQKNVNELIKFEDAENRIDKLSFDEFYQLIQNDKSLISDW